MQTYGHPPKELMGNMTMSVDEHGMPHLPAGIESPDQCCVGWFCDSITVNFRGN